MPQNVPTIIRGDFNVDILTETCQSITLCNFMNTQKFKLFFFEYTIINKTQINHISPNLTHLFQVYLFNMFSLHMKDLTHIPNDEV
jgi:hypothetical protein